MQGNHRQQQQQHYNNQAADSQQPAANRQIELNGLPTSRPLAGYPTAQFLATSPQNYHRLLAEQQPMQLRLDQLASRPSQQRTIAASRDYCADWQQICLKLNTTTNNNNNNNNTNCKPNSQMQLHHKQPAPEAEPDGQPGAETANGRDLYASQLRQSHIQHQFRHNQVGSPTSRHLAAGQLQGAGPSRAAGQQQATGRQQQQQEAASKQQATGRQQAAGAEQQAAGKQQQQQQQALHVNFNRANRQGANEDEEPDSRKKKYLTAKYGQQQMNLIKKRLKIEMWLHEQLQELAKGSRFQAELDEIDIELDELLDLDDEESRRRWLKKTLAPFEDLPGPKVDTFIGQVLEQSRLL